MKFKYIALNQDQQNLAGTITANTEIDARDKLNKLGLAVLQIHEIPESSSDDATNRFEFEARDLNQKKVVGTIAAENKISALKRLSEEYQLKVNKLYATNSTPEEINSSHQEVIKLYQQLSQLEDTQTQNTKAKEEKAQNQYRDQIISEAQKIINEVQSFLQKYNDKLKESEKTHLTSEVVHLQNILRTENIENLKLSCQSLLGYIQEKELFIEKGVTLEQKTNIKVETQTLIDELKGIKKSTNNVQIEAKAGFLSTIKELFFTPDESEDPQIIQLEIEVQKTSQELKNYLKLLFSAKKKSYRQQAMKALKPLFRKWWRLKSELKSIHGAKITHQKQASFLGNLTAYLCGFYLGLYFFLHFISVKNFNFILPNFVYVHYTAILMYSIIGAFILHISVMIANKLAAKANPLSKFTYIIAALTFLFIWLNL